MTKRIKRYLTKLVDQRIERRLVDITAQVGDEAQVAVKEIKDTIEPTVARVAQVFLNDRVSQLQKLTEDNMQMFQTQLQIMNASYSRSKALVKLLDPLIEGNLEAEVARMGFKYQVEMVLADLETKQDAHPRIIEHLQSKLGKLYQQARDEGWLEVFSEAVDRRKRDWLENYEGGGQ